MESYEFVIAEPEKHKELILEFLLEHFRTREPITASLNMTRDECTDFFRHLVHSGLKDPVSYIALCNGEIVGCRLNELVLSSDRQNQRPKSPNKYSSDKANIISDLIDELCGRMEDAFLPERTGAGHLMKFVVLCVHASHLRQGLARRLVEMSLSKARDVGCDRVVAAATALKTQRLFDSLHFETLRRVDYDRYYVNGDAPFARLDNGTTCAKLMAKKLC